MHEPVLLNTLLYDWEETIITKQLLHVFEFSKKHIRSIYNHAYTLCMEMGFLINYNNVF